MHDDDDDDNDDWWWILMIISFRDNGTPDIYAATSVLASSSFSLSLGKLTRQVGQKSRADLYNYLMSIHHDFKVTTYQIIKTLQRQ